MDRVSISENEDLRSYGVSVNTLRQIDVSAAVMNRIHTINSLHKPSFILTAFNSQRRAAIITSAFVILLLTTVTVQAATGNLSIFNKAGKSVVTVKDAIPIITSPSKSIDQLLAQYRDQARAALMPGDLVAYYINDEAAYNPYDTVNPLKYEYLSPRMPSYEDYLRTAEQTSAPMLNPAYLPDGFRYKNGDITPVFPIGAKNKQYVTLLDRLLHKAENTHRNDKLIIEPVLWTEAGAVMLTFTDGKSNILMSAIKGEAVTFYQDVQITSEIVTIHDQEVIYMNARSATTSNTYFTNKIGWYNEQAGVVYSIEDGADSPLSKEDIMRIAEGIIMEKPRESVK